MHSAKYAIRRIIAGGLEDFYGPVWGAFYAPDYTPHVFNAERFTNKRHAVQWAKALAQRSSAPVGIEVVEVGFGGARHFANRVIRVVQTVR